MWCGFYHCALFGHHELCLRFFTKKISQLKSTFFSDVGRTSSVHVSVRSLPRCEEVPRVTCPHNVVSVSAATSNTTTTQQQPQEYLPLSPDGTSSSAASSSGSSEVSTPITASPVPNAASINEDSNSQQDETKLSMAGALEWRENHQQDRDPENLRKSLVRSRLQAECQEKLPRSDSLDSMLGDSLLDPPQSLQKIPPKRYQSPSRCGSPSLEAPDHLLFGNASGESILLLLQKIR